MAMGRDCERSQDVEALGNQRSRREGGGPLAAAAPRASWLSRLEPAAFAPVTETSRWYYLWVAFLLLVIAWGVYAYSHQLREGLIVTGMRDRISWGLYITTFVFFIGISHAGTLISAILRVTQAKWRTPVTRMAESIVVMMILIIPIAVSVHTGVSWIFAMTLRVPWNSTIFGAFFVAGAIFSGIATLIIVMAILRKVYHLEE